MSSAESSFWDRWNTEYRGPEAVTPDSLPHALGRAVVDAVTRLGLRAPRVLEVGCGTGWLAESLGEIGSYEGWDLSSAAVAIAKARSPRLRFAVVDICDIADGVREFDVVVAADTIAYFRCQDLAMRKIRSLVAESGYLVLSTVNPFAYKRMSWIGPPGAGQARKWLTRRELLALLSDASFEVISSRTILPAGDQGVLRILNARRLNAPLGAVVGEDRLRRVKEFCGLGQYRLVVAQARTRDAPKTSRLHP